MTLTFELIRDIIKVNASIKYWVCMSNGSAMRALTDRQTDTHTQTGPILYPPPLTREGINQFCLGLGCVALAPIIYKKNFNFEFFWSYPTPGILGRYLYCISETYVRYFLFCQRRGMKMCGDCAACHRTEDCGVCDFCKVL